MLVHLVYTGYIHVYPRLVHVVHKVYMYTPGWYILMLMSSAITALDVLNVACVILLHEDWEKELVLCNCYYNNIYNVYHTNHIGMFEKYHLVAIFHIQFLIDLQVCSLCQLSSYYSHGDNTGLTKLVCRY